MYVKRPHTDTSCVLPSPLTWQTADCFCALLLPCAVCRVPCVVQRLRELKELAASRRAGTDASRIGETVAAPTALVTSSKPLAASASGTARLDTLDASNTTASPRPTSTVPHHLPLHSDVASALPADFFDGEEASEQEQASTVEADAQPAASDATNVNSLPHPTAAPASAGEGELVSAVLDVEQARAMPAEAEAERDKRDTEAAIAFAISLSKQQSLPEPALSTAASPSSPRPASPVPLPAPSIPDALEAFEAELAAAEAELEGSSAEEASRLAGMRRSMDEVEEDDRRQRLDDIKRRVAEAKRKRDERHVQLRAEESEVSHKKRKGAQDSASGRDVAEMEDDSDLMAELDDMFTWRKQR